MLQLDHFIPVKDKLAANQVLKISLMKEVIKPTRPHRHAGYHELIILQQGAGFHEVDGQEFEINPPTAYYLRPGQTHCWNFSSIPKGYVLLFKEELLSKQDVSLLFDFPAEIPLNADHALFELFTLFFADFRNKKLDHDTSKAYLQLLFAKIKPFTKTAKPKLDSASHLVQEFKRLINQHGLAQKQLLFYTDQLNVTTAVLNAACKKAISKTPALLINERILLEGKLLLSATAKPIGEIAIDLGFADTSHFVKFFKQNTSLTPGLYREMAVSKN
jgi:AraC-like DNA-binding protein